MTERHPDELLASYVDGELEAEERRQVKAHLASCARCTEEVAIAKRAFKALSALEEVPAPLGLATPAIQRAHPQKRMVARLQWAAGSAAAAALIVAIGLILWRSGDVAPTGGAEDRREVGPQMGEEGAGAPEPQPLSGSFYVETTNNYTREQLDAIAQGSRNSLSYDDGVQITAAQAGSEEVDRALECVGDAGLRAEDGAQLNRIEAARFEDTRVYIVYSTPEEGGQDVWVVDREECQIRYVASSSG
jgi:hypothetical protein